MFMGSISTLIYTSELILCSTICVHSATRRRVNMYLCFLFAAIHHLKSSPTFSVRPRSSGGGVTSPWAKTPKIGFFVPIGGTSAIMEFFNLHLSKFKKIHDIKAESVAILVK